MEQGLIQVYTGNGKGKTTAALGLALRAVGRGWKVLMIQFMKGEGQSGEYHAAQKLLPELKITPTGRTGLVSRENPDSEDIRLAREGFRLAERAMESQAYDLVILDEINVAVDFGLIPLADLLRLLEAKAEKVELVLTGRNANPEVLRRADLVSEVMDRKHYYPKGISARVGIEY